MFFLLAFLAVLLNGTALLPLFLGGDAVQVFLLCIPLTLGALWQAREFARKESYDILTHRANLLGREPPGDPLPRARMLFTTVLFPWMPVALGILEGDIKASASVFATWVWVEAMLFFYIAKFDEDEKNLSFQEVQ